MRNLAWAIRLEAFYWRNNPANESRADWWERNQDILVLHY